MHESVYAEKNAVAQAKLTQAAHVLANRFGLAPELVEALTPTGNMDPEIRTLKQKEAVANILEALVAVAWASEAQGTMESGPKVPKSKKGE